MQRRTLQLKTGPASRAFLLLPQIWRAYLYQQKDKKEAKKEATLAAQAAQTHVTRKGDA